MNEHTDESILYGEYLTPLVATDPHIKGGGRMGVTSSFKSNACSA